MKNQDKNYYYLTPECQKKIDFTKIHPIDYSRIPKIDYDRFKQEEDRNNGNNKKSTKNK